MEEDQSNLDSLLSRLESLIARQEDFSREINELRSEIFRLQHNEDIQEEKEEISEKELIENKAGSSQPLKAKNKTGPLIPAPKTKTKKERPRLQIKTDLEKFIGENLINKIGIAITVIGVGIGVKYSIDHDLITPLMRVITGYVTGIVLLIVGIQLKRNYENYSAVLVSGAMAMMYFITYAAFSFYDLMPDALAFGVMVIFTVFTVLAAISYNQEVISLIGLVGAYAVPFLLSDDSGNVKILFSYISIINIGILITAVLRYWKMLYYSSFILSWLIFGFWYLDDFLVEEHFALTLIFSVIFFLTFYATFLVNKLIKKETFSIGDIIFLMLNSFIYYGIGYVTLEEHEVGEQLLGLFTVANALIHFVISVGIFRQHLSDRNLFFLVAGMVLAFVTLAIPVQLDGKWVTLLWIGEAAILFWIGRTKKVPIYEKLSYPLIFLAFFSLVHDWNEVYGRYISDDQEAMITPIFNVQFLSSLIFIASLVFILFLFNSDTYKRPTLPKFWKSLMNLSLPAIAFISIYFSIHFEIENYWNQLLVQSAIEVNQGEFENIKIIENQNLHLYKSAWLSIYSLIFFTAFSLLNAIKIKNVRLGNFNLIMSGIVLYIFLLGGLFTLSELRESYLNPSQAKYFEVGIYNLVIRYIALLAAVSLMSANYLYLKRQDSVKRELNTIFEIAIHISIIWMLSSELIHWLDIAGFSESYKLGLSILWGLYSLFMIAFGIWKKKKYLRIMAIVIFAGTLVKLFFYDVSHMETIAKTILFVSLGVLLLIISFLYNKYKHLISDEE